MKSLNKGKETKVWILKAIVLCKFFFEVDILFKSLKNQVMKLISSHATFDSNSAFIVQELFHFI